MTRSRTSAELPTSSMADIAFLLLTFFLVTTQINNDKGIALLLPSYINNINPVEIKDRNLFTIQINSLDQFLVEGEHTINIDGLRKEIKVFILNNGKDIRLSESPAQAIVSLKADRGTSHKIFIAALDEIQAAYYEIYSARAGMTPKQFRELDQNNAKEKLIYEKARMGIPMNISIAEPGNVSNGI